MILTVTFQVLEIYFLCVTGTDVAFLDCKYKREFNLSAIEISFWIEKNQLVYQAANYFHQFLVTKWI